MIVTSKPTVNLMPTTLVPTTKVPTTFAYTTLPQKIYSLEEMIQTKIESTFVLTSPPIQIISSDQIIKGIPDLYFDISCLILLLFLLIFIK